MKAGKTPLVSIHLMLNLGSASDPKGKEGLTLLAADMLDEGAGKLDALQLSDKLGELATDYSSSAGIDYVLLSMNALAENLEPSLELLSDIVLRPQLSPMEFKRRQDHHIASALTSRDDPREARSLALATALFGDRYAGRSSSGTVDSLKGISLWDVKSHVKELTVPTGAHLIVAGDVELDEVNKLASKYFGKWTGSRKSAEPTLADEPEGGIAYVVNFEDAAQSSLAVARRAGANGDPNYFAEEVMNDRLGGSFTGRINMNLREDKGYTYGAQSLFRRYQYAGYFGIYSDVISDATAASVKEIFAELEAVCASKPLTERERNEAVEGMLLGFVMDFAETESISMRLASLPLRDRPVDYWVTWPKNISDVSTKRANEAARPFCDSSQFSVVIAGDKDKLTPGLEELGLKVIEMDREGHLLK
jgi:zinc protease